MGILLWIFLNILFSMLPTRSSEEGTNNLNSQPVSMGVEIIVTNRVRIMEIIMLINIINIGVSMLLGNSISNSMQHGKNNSLKQMERKPLQEQCQVHQKKLLKKIRIVYLMVL